MGNTSDRTFSPGSLLNFSLRSKFLGETLEEKVTHLFEQLNKPLYHYLFLITWSAHDSEEIVQEVFLRLHRHLLDHKTIDNVRAWVFRVGHNLAIDRGRTSREADSLSEPATSRQAEGHLAAATPNPEMIALEKERQTALARAVAALPAVQRQALLLRREGFRYREIAGILAIGETTVIDHITRAIARLHRELHDDAR